jgi:hypothetical protein
MIHFNHYVMNVTIHVKIVKVLVAVIAKVAIQLNFVFLVIHIVFVI